MKKQKKQKHKFNGADLILLIIGISTAWFIHRVFEVMVVTEVEPSSTVTGYFAFITAECAILWRLHESKKKRDSKKEQDDTEFGGSEDDINDIGNGEG